MGNPDDRGGPWAWLRRWRPCVSSRTHQGKSAEQWAQCCQEQALEIATLEGAVRDRDQTIDGQALKIEQLTDLIHDLRRLTEREGV